MLLSTVKRTVPQWQDPWSILLHEDSEHGNRQGVGGELHWHGVDSSDDELRLAAEVELWEALSPIRPYDVMQKPITTG